MNSRPILRAAGGGESAARDSAEERGFRRADPVRDQLKAVRRSLWILGAKLECLPAKIERACRKSGLVADGYGPEQPRHAGLERPAPNAGIAKGGLRARWKLARLRSRADRAERRAAVAVHDASASFGAALESVLRAAVARVKADTACQGSCCARAAGSVEERPGWERIQPTTTSGRDSS